MLTIKLLLYPPMETITAFNSYVNRKGIYENCDVCVCALWIDPMNKLKKSRVSGNVGSFTLIGEK